jgi:hypothetical protein
MTITQAITRPHPYLVTVDGKPIVNCVQADDVAGTATALVPHPDHDDHPELVRIRPVEYTGKVEITWLGAGEDPGGSGQVNEAHRYEEEFFPEMYKA